MALPQKFKTVTTLMLSMSYWKTGRFHEALEFLWESQLTSETLYLASLMARYLNEFDWEKSILEKLSLCSQPSKNVVDFDLKERLTQKILNLYTLPFSYLEERKKWHRLSWFERCCPRERRRKIPTQLGENSTDCKDITVVTSGSTKTMAAVMESLASIRDTVGFETRPLVMLDLGLTTTERTCLKTRYGVSSFIDVFQLIEKRMGWKTDKERVSRLYSMNAGLLHAVAHAFVEAHLKTRFFLWIDAGSWIQTDTTIDTLYALALEQGVGIIERNAQETVAELVPCGKLSDDLDNDLKIVKACTSGLFCVDREHAFSKNFTECVVACLNEEDYLSLETGFAFNKAIYVHNRRVKLLQDNHYYRIEGSQRRPCLNDANELIHPKNKKTIGCLYLSPTVPMRNEGYCCSLRKIKEEDSFDMVKSSLHYRTLPDHDKEALLELINTSKQVFDRELMDLTYNHLFP